jgi:uncharacterized protein HemX
MTALISWIVKFVLQRLGLSGFVGGLIASAVIAALFAGWSGYMVHVGYKWADNKAQVVALAREKAQLEATAKELQRQLAASNAIIAADTETAATAADHIADLEKQINETPVNSATCLDRAAVGRVRNVR